MPVITSIDTSSPVNAMPIISAPSFVFINLVSLRTGMIMPAEVIAATIPK
ncbi:hypothetical protein MCHI_004033 [Candidatus Magnetoovum chiemensis]|nr:hypothetical protein MCHI_004033 [Candidatus Magnetoovum chiemensis]